MPLDKGTSDAKCVECHEDKTKGKKIVHAAVQSGCQTCHFVRGSGDDTRIVLKNARTVTLCTSCHEDKKQSSPTKPVHSPVNQDCVQCHDPHLSDNKGLLKKATSGEKDANLCLTCHKQGLNVPEKGSRHAALDSGCDSCHVTHKSGERGKPEFEFHLTKTAPALCLDCHDAKDEALVKKHNGQPFGAANCVQCHDPHQSTAPKLMQANQHSPFEDKTGCNTCHEAAKDGKVVLTQADSKALCLSCHEEVGKKIDSAKVAHPGAQGDCIACHDPHAGKSARFIKPNPVQACTACHSNQAEIHKSKSVLHSPAFNQSCSVCHEPHGGNNEHLVRATGNDLCATCHVAGSTKAKSGENGAADTLFDGAVTLPSGYLQKVRKITATDHPVPKHPVSGPNKFDKDKKAIACTTCHTPHGGARDLFVGDLNNSRALCMKCHK